MVFSVHHDSKVHNEFQFLFWKSPTNYGIELHSYGGLVCNAGIRQWVNSTPVRTRSESEISETPCFFLRIFRGIWNYIDTKCTWQVKSIIKYKHEIAAKTKIVHGLLYEYCIYSTHGVQVHTVGYRYQFREKKGFENPTL